jgi:peptidyl-prolyl cis-trans isomerase C
MAPRAPIKLNGVVLPPQMIAAEAQHHPSPTPAAAFQAAARALIVRTLLLEEAGRAAIAATPELIAPGKRELDDEARIRALMEARIAMFEPDDDECLALYDADPSRFRSPDLYEASHILFLAHPHDVQAYGAAVEQAQAVIDELIDAPARFESLAREHSQCDSRANGGRLGQIVRGATVPEFEKALQELEEGQIAPAPVRSRFGVHVLRLDARARGQVLPFAYVREQIADYLTEKRWRRDVAAYIEQIVSRAHIEGIDMAPPRPAKVEAA